MQSLNSKNDHVSRTRAYEATIARYASTATATASTIAESLRREFTGLSVISKAVEGTPGSTLISESQRLGAEIIVVGNKRVQGPARILGSIARTVASGANCDLYVVHTHQK
ncbi:universal stress protein [Nesterenkonia sphaerica]|uniref:Universal stress protein n=1 Tax=Nesterenkonia sphaerica TaxID=1804988 RepID=A0A5R8ZXB0_9MICC|nr:universal stress protein [Nesterenkonia sphaerica]